MEEISNLLLNREMKENSLFEKTFNKSNYNIQTLKKTGELTGHTGCVNTIGFNKTGDLMVTGSDDNSVKIWNFNTRTCIQTLHGHESNVFTAEFVPHKSNREVVSGGNDSDIRHYELTTKTCTVYQHHQSKVLKISFNPLSTDTFLSCSGDGTVRMFDIRMKYSNSYTEAFTNQPNLNPINDFNILPQIYGGGRLNSLQSNLTPTNNNNNNGNSSNSNSSLLVDINTGTTLRRSQRLAINMPKTSVFSLDFHPYDGYSFITALSDGTVRLFDLRNIQDHSGLSFVNIYRNLDMPWPSDAEATGCVFSKDGKEILATYLSDLIYLFDVNKNYSKELNIDYFKDHSIKIPKKKRRAIHHHRGRKKLSKLKESKNENIDLPLYNNSNNNNIEDDNEIKNISSNFSLRKTQTNININKTSSGLENNENSNSNPNEMNESDEDDENVEISYDNLMAIDFYEELIKQYGETLNSESDDSDIDDDDLSDDSSKSFNGNSSTTENETYSYDSDNDDYGYNKDDDDSYYHSNNSSSNNSNYYINSSNSSQINTSTNTNSSNSFSGGSSNSNPILTPNSSSSFSSSSNASNNQIPTTPPLTSSIPPLPQLPIQIPKSYISKYDGHISLLTIKTCNFYGPNSEYVMSGSDDGKIFIWDKKTCKIVRVLEGHHDCVNSIIQHPTLASIVTSGIDEEAYIWEPEGTYPNQQKLLKSSKYIGSLIKNKEKRIESLHGRTDNLIPSQCSQQ